MTNQYQGGEAQPSDPRSQDWYLRRVAIAQSGPRQAGRNDVRFGTSYGINRGRIPGTQIIAATIILNNFSGGGGVLSGPISAFPDRYYQAVAVDAGYPGFLLPAQLWSSTGNVGSTTADGIHYLNIFSTLIWGEGGTNDKCLWKETSATDPTPAAITGAGTAGRPGSIITGIWPIIIGGATGAIRACIGRAGAVPMVMSDAAGTMVTTLDAAWNPTWWVCQTSLPGNPIIHQSGNTIFNSLTSASAINAVPTGSTALTGTVRAGGYLIGECQLQNGPPRVYFVEPKADNTSGMLAFGSETLGYVESIPLDGIVANVGDLQRLTFYNMPNGILQAMYVQTPAGGAIIASDGQRTVLHDGVKEQNVRFLETNPPNTSLATLNPIVSGVTHKVRGFAQRGADLYIYTNTINAADTTVQTLWRMDWENNTWHRISTALSVGAGAITTSLAGWAGHPVSINTGFGQTGNIVTGLGSSGFSRIFLSTTDENPYILYRRTTGAGASTGNQVEAGTTSTGLLTPAWTIDGVEGVPFVCEGITLGGDAWAAVTATEGIYVAVYGDVVVAPGDLERGMSASAGINHTFYASEAMGYPTTLGTDKFRNNSARATRLQVQIAPILSSGVRYMVNCLPVYIHLLFFLDGKVVTPAVARATK